jgi:hypothetical protein
MELFFVDLYSQNNKKERTERSSPLFEVGSIKGLPSVLQLAVEKGFLRKNQTPF